VKIFVIGLDCAAPEILLRTEGLTNLRSLMQRGCYGRLESVIPPITVPAWACMATSQDPGSLGVYGFRNRADHSYDRLQVVTSAAIQAPAIWDHLGNMAKTSVVIGVPPSFPPRKVNGISIGCFLTPDTTRHDYTHPASLKSQIDALVGEYPVDVKGFRTDNKAWLRDEIYRMTEKHFRTIRHLMTNTRWDYFQFVEIGLDRMHHGFWKYHDPQHRLHEPNSPFARAILDYYAYLDEEIGQTLKLLDDETIVAVVSDHGAQRLDGGFCVNEWLSREGLLTLRERPSQPTPFSPAMVDWEKTRVWSEGGYYARVFLNVKGREPSGTIPPEQYEDVLADLTQRLEALEDDRGRPMGTRVFRPQEVYKKVNRVAPDLIVHFGDLYWRSIGGVGYSSLHVQENDTGPDDCNHAQFGVFVLSAPGLPARGEVEGMHLLDVSPTLLDLAGYPVPEAMQGKTLLQRV
jgi:predicted AlkP superfamily phosphohydrolase/phosphomutase